MIEMEKQKAELTQRVADLTGRFDFEIIPVTTQNWNDDLSPWEFADGKNSFGGYAEKFLQTVKHLSDSLNASSRCSLMLAGYSLAGLFCLWAADRVLDFDCVVSCSGSLWFPGFIESDLRPKCKKVYLSVGDKEAKTKHPLMRHVEDISRQYFERLNSSGLYEKIVYEINPGNHFTDVVERMAKGISWGLME